MSPQRMKPTPEEEKPLKKNPDDINRCTGSDDDEFDDLDTGWAWVTMLASFGSFCLIGGTMYAVGIIHSTLLDQFHENVSLTSWVGALHSALISAGGPLSSAVIDRYSCRTALIASGVCYVIGYLGTAFAPTIEVAIFTCGIIAGMGGAFGYTASMVVVGFNFRKRLNIALGVSVSGVGVGLFAMAPIMQFSRDYYGTTGFFIILATCALNIITFGVMCFPSKLEQDAQQKRKYEAAIKRADSQEIQSFAVLRSYGHLLLNKPVMCLCFSMFNYCLGTFLTYLHLPSYSVAKGFTHLEASFFVSISGILAVIGRLMTGVIANFNLFPDICLYSGSMGILSIATFFLPQYASIYWGQVIYAASLGLFSGCCYVVMASVNILFVGVNYMSAAIGLQLFFGGIGALVGPVCAGVIVDAGGSYDLSFYIAAACVLLATLSSAATLCFTRADKSVVDLTDMEVNVVTDITKMLNGDSKLNQDSKISHSDNGISNGDSKLSYGTPYNNTDTCV